jgi:hypothetical protein
LHLFSIAGTYVNRGFTGTFLNGKVDDFSVRWTGGLQVDTAGLTAFKLSRMAEVLFV